jgi:fatty acid desaturase
MIFAGYAEDEARYEKALEESTESGKKKSFLEALSVSVPFFIAFGIFALSFWYGKGPSNIFFFFLFLLSFFSFLFLSFPFPPS